MVFYNKKPLLCRCGILLALLLVVLLAAVWFFRASAVSYRAPRRVILISIDTCRADYLSCYGCPLKTTPNIDTVAAEAVRFERAIAPNPLTLPSHSTMMTGTIPPHHGIHDNLNYTLNQSNVTLTEILKRAGFRTGAVISASVLKDEFGLDQGFDNYDDEFDERLEGDYHIERRGAEATQHAV
ncbi:MAG: sulfatase-like hydrolase/transferase, partial [Planctomycetota bacterium]